MAAKVITEKIVVPDGEPPKEFLLIKYGLTETTEGPYRLDEQHAKEVLSTFKNRNLKLFFDYEHLSLAPETPDQGIAAGWFEIALRNDGIWATNIKWTEKAFEHLKKREYAYFSPVLKLNKNGYVTRLINCALTNLPATDKLEALVELSERLEEELQYEMDNEMDDYLLVLADKYSSISFKPSQGVISACKTGLKWHKDGLSGKGLEADTVRWANRLASGQSWTPEKAKRAKSFFARHEVDKKGKDWDKPSPGKVAWYLWGGDAGRSQVNKLVRQMEAIDTKIQKNTELGHRAMKLSDNEKLEVIEDAIKDVVDEVTDDIIDDVVDEKIENKRKGELMKEHLKRLDMTMDHMMSCGLHCTKMMMETDDEAMKDMFSKMHSYAMKMAEMLKEKRTELDPHGMYVKQSDSYYNAKFGENLDEQTRILSEIEKIAEDKGEALLGKVTAYKVALDSVKELSEKVQLQDKTIKDLKDQIALSEKSRIVEDAIVRHKKLLPKQKEWALSLSVDQLKSFLENAPILTLSEKVIDLAPQDNTNYVALNEFDKEMIRTYNLDEKRYMEEKRKRLGN